MNTTKLLFTAAISSMLLATSCEKENGKTGEFRVNENASKIEWKGSAPDHFHLGSFKVQGELKAGSSGQIKSGNFIIPIASIENFDLEGAVKQQLLDHLKSPDFFNMALYPNATFHITKSEPYNGNEEGAVADANFLLTGNFNMLGKELPISFPAKITVNKESLIGEANLKIDRTKWGMTYDSDPTKPLYIYPDIEIKLKLVTEKTK